MARNVEIKARLSDPNRTSGLAHALALDPPVLIHQTDTFFTCPRGRLKLRDFENGTGELIFYQRPDQAGPKVSRYAISPTAAPDSLLTVLGSAFPVLGMVKKTRTLLMAGRTRIHLDEVAGLGSFLELEVVLTAGETIADGKKEADELMKQLQVSVADLIDVAYLDLILAKQQ